VLFHRINIVSTEEDDHMDIAMDMVEDYILEYLKMDSIKETVHRERMLDREMVGA
jgi:hypothetical protein